VPEGEQKRLLLEGTPYETAMYVFGSGRPGNVLMVLGGVHGNEPGGWMGADRLLDRLRPSEGGFIIVPRANKQAAAAFVRTTDDLGDLNRLYPGDPAGKPMARMAFEITEAAREFHVNFLVDMHESWAFYNNRNQNGTAFLGQTIATNVDEPAISLAEGVVQAVNGRIQAPREEFFYRNRVGSGNGPPPDNLTPEQVQALGGIGPPTGSARGGTSSLSLPRHIPGLSTLLVEMGQQQALDRRAALHVDVAMEVARRISIISA
jgi:hypothetical protein